MMGVWVRYGVEVGIREREVFTAVVGLFVFLGFSWFREG